LQIYLNNKNLFFFLFFFFAKKDTKTVKICDFGTAFSEEEAMLVEYLVSRFYRAPEIVLGYPYDCSIDVWSVACTLYELFTSKFLFEGRNNN
jgi:serine/threonine-protein kinase PRP4